MEYDKRNPSFPSDFISPEQKETKEYALKWAEAIDGVGINGNDNGLFPGNSPVNEMNRYALRRAYARAEQPISKYKPILGIKDKRTANDPGSKHSYRALNFENLDIATKFVNVLIGIVMKQNNDVGVQAIDKRAEDRKRKRLIELQEQVINDRFLADVSRQTGIQFETPVNEDIMPPPQTLGEVELYRQMFYKEKYCLIVQDLLKLLNENDDYTEILSEIIRDLIEVGAAATKVYRVGNKIIRRRCVPERMVISSTNKSTCDDVRYVGEYWDLTIGQLKELVGDELSEAEYRKIAEQASNTTFSYNDTSASKYFTDNFCYPWDNTKITVGDFVWWSPNWTTNKVTKDRNGNVSIYKQDYDWWDKLSRKGVTEKSFNESNENKVIRHKEQDQYGCLWVKGTKFVMKFGKSKDMLKNGSNLGKTIGPYTIYKLKKCPIESIMPTLDNIQIQWLQFQHHSAKSVPAGSAIEFTALQDISIEGSGGKKITPKEALQIYFETGILLWRRRDAQGNLSNFKPVQELSGGISNAMEKHFQLMIQGINLIRDQWGLNKLRDASTPSGEMGKAVAEMASGASDDALRGLHFAVDSINLGTQKRTVMNLSGMAASGLAPQYSEALGLQPMAFMSLMSDLTYNELGVYLMKQPTEQMKEWINKYCEVGISKGTLYEEEAFEIQNEPNIHRAIQLLKMYRNQKRKEKQEEMQAQYKAEEEKNINSANATAAAARKTLAMEQEAKQAQIMAEAEAKLMVESEITANKAFLMRVQSKLDTQQALTEEEAHRLTEIEKANVVGKFQLMAAKSRPKPKPAAKK